MKVVFHIDEITKWLETKQNVKNLLKAAPKTEIIVTVNGHGITGYLDDQNADFLALTDVTFHACANGISEKNLPEQVIVVPAGVLDLIELQEKGFAYIKP
ncbi:hypothetical protein IGI47_002733 [Enterococcus sp. AZ191]|uniref:DsrE family protein n=1 Tax=Enterococcus sp. AZ191 TaxID=2774639 RepID=UPI003F1E608E